MPTQFCASPALSTGRRDYRVRLRALLLSGDFVGFELSHMRHIYPLPLSYPLRAYLSVAPAHSDISVGSTYPLCSTSPSRCLGSTPCYSPHKSVGTRSGVVSGAAVDGLASWAVGAPRADCLAVPDKGSRLLRTVIRYRVSSLSRIATIVADGELQMRFATPVDLRIVSSAAAPRERAGWSASEASICSRLYV